jgi:hypothetical protein
MTGDKAPKTRQEMATDLVISFAGLENKLDELLAGHPSGLADTVKKQLIEFKQQMREILLTR